MAEDGGGKHSRALVEILVLPTPEPEDLTRFTMEEAADFGGNAFGALMMPFYLGEFIVTVSEAAGVGGVAVQVGGLPVAMINDGGCFYEVVPLLSIGSIFFMN